MDDQSSITGRDKIFFLLYLDQAGSVPNTDSYPVDIGTHFLRAKTVGI
jgi:hypothetical protein